MFKSFSSLWSLQSLPLFPPVPHPCSSVLLCIKVFSSCTISSTRGLLIILSRHDSVISPVPLLFDIRVLRVGRSGSESAVKFFAIYAFSDGYICFGCGSAALCESVVNILLRVHLAHFAARL